ncbi:hypothetical protein AN958_01967 [Leucoagaricus sp. SymC.cos]|nr:hypothetical protein AN958_01967 [Leucoagaricus sp. SymC.cos]
MQPEMRSCSVKTFLEHYAPFMPTQDTVDAARERLTEDCTTEVHSEGNTTRCWSDFDCPPSEMHAIEPKIFKNLEEIIEVLNRVDRERLGRRPVRFQYFDCAYSNLKGETPGATFKVDAYFGPKSLSSPGSTSLETSKMAVIAEYKKNKSSDNNRSQLVSAASYLMNDDPRRMWMYGITIEDNEMSLWYFSRSHSVKSEPFDFTTDIGTFTPVFITFLLATPTEMGFDTTVERVTYKDKIQYIYTIKSAKGQARRFLTLNPIHNPRSLCITGRKTRVWRVTELPKRLPKDLDTVEGCGEYALKDVWLNEGSPTERDNLQEVFGKLEDFKDCPEWPAEPLSQLLRDALRNKQCKNYFMEIECDGRGFSTKGVPDDATADPSILASDVRQMTEPEKDKHIVKGSSQSTPPPSFTTDPQSHQSPPGLGGPPRKFEVKRQYRLIYKEVGTALHSSPDFSSTISGLRDALIAVVLLALVNWVHRDISAQNIILVEQEAGHVVGKLSDLEFAKEYSESPEGGHDPKTSLISCFDFHGSPYFMPYELHAGVLIRNMFLQSELDIDPSNPFGVRIPMPPETTEFEGPPFYCYEYDLESLWWILVWIVLRVMHLPSIRLLYEVFRFGARPSKVRTSVFTIMNDSRLYKAMEPTIKAEFDAPIRVMHTQLFKCYRTNAVPYGNTAGVMYMAFDRLVDATQTSLKNADHVFADMPSTHAGAKRSRSVSSDANGHPSESNVDEPSDDNGNEDETQAKKIRTETGNQSRKKSGSL